MSSTAEVVITLVVAVLVIARQTRARPLVAQTMYLLPGLLILLGLFALHRMAGHGHGPGGTGAWWLTLDVGVAVAWGLLRAPTVRLFARAGSVWWRGTGLTIALWAAAVAGRIVITILGDAHGATRTLRHGLPLSLGATLVSQYAVLHVRARRAGLPFGRSGAQARAALAAEGPKRPALVAAPTGTPAAPRRDRGSGRGSTGASPSADPRPSGRASGPLAGFARVIARHRFAIIAGWIVLLLAATVAHRQIGGVYSDTLSISGSAAEQGLDILHAHQPSAGGQAGQVVYVDHRGALGAKRAPVRHADASLARLPHVLAVSDPFTPATFSGAHSTAYATIRFDANPQGLGTSYLNAVDRALAPARRAGVSVSEGGALGQAAAPRSRDARSELLGILIAIAVLLTAFGSVLAALLPLVSAVIGTFTAIGVLGTLAAAVTLGTASPTLATMMALGVGIDYALFLGTRFRQQILDGSAPIQALERTLSTSGRAVLTAAGTVIIALLSLFASGVTFIGELGLAGAIGVALSALAALSLVPALLAVSGGSIDRLAVRRPAAEPAADVGATGRHAARLARHPLRWTLGGMVALAVIAIPVLSIQLGHVGAGSEPASFTERQAYDALSRAFGPGTNGPLTIVVSLDHGIGPAVVPALSTALRSSIAATPHVRDAEPFRSSPDRAILSARVIPDSGPQSMATSALVTRLQDHVLPAVLHAHAGAARAEVTGTTAVQLDFADTVARRLPIIVATVIAAAFLLMLASFRAPLIALQAAILNLFSIGAALGVVVAVFQWGWGSSVLGLSGTVPIESYVPMMLFAIVFGLSMDYQVFLLSRVREHWLNCGENTASVTRGLEQTARVIACAAAIMAAVFLSFLLSSNVVIKMLALGLGVSVIIDATVIRLVIVPALMIRLGEANWWTPRRPGAQAPRRTGGAIAFRGRGCRGDGPAPRR